ncbi:ATP-dependent helicase [Naumannella huperziae]
MSENRAGPAWRLLPPVVAREPRPELDPDQRRVVEHATGPLLVLAGPGTGKTTTLVESVAARVDDGADPGSILVLTFSRRAAGALRDRIARRLDRPGAIPRVLTFHGLAHALVRRFGPDDAMPRLLTAPEQEFRVRELLSGPGVAAGWPAELAAALPTRAFAGQVRDVLARARQLGLDPDDLAGLGRRADRADWSAAGAFMAEYLDVLDAEGVLDYAELVHRSRILLADPAVREAFAREFGQILVDEYQDTDPAQIRLLRALAGERRNVVAFGDPDQSVFAFRGAHSRGILDFGADFADPDGTPAPILALGTGHRHGARIAAALAGVARRLPLARPLPPPVHAALREPAPAQVTDRVEVHTCASPSAEAEHIADLLRSAHLRDGLDWSEMAVLVRSGRRGIPPLGRALLAAGVPIEVAGDEIPLAAEPAVRPLLLGCQVVAAGGVPDADQAHRLLVSPLGGLDSLGVRRLGRALRSAERAELGEAVLPAPSADLVHRALAEPERLDALPDGPEVRAARDLAGLLADARRAAAAGPAEDVVWALWSGTDWPQRLRTEALGGGESARRANRDLDAVVALFDVAGRAAEVSGARGLAGFLAEVEAQQIPADTQREAAVRGSAVRLLTAHRAKGLQWPLVVVAGVQEGLWPDLRGRDSLLEPTRLGPAGLLEPEPGSARLAAERRLFLVACSRAARRLVVTAVAGTEGEGDQPSRFLAELGVPVRELAGRPARPLNLGSLVAELRRVSVDPAEPPVLRDAAAQRLARLAEARDDAGRPLVPMADPASWWGMDEATTGAPRADDGPLVLSSSEIGAALDCPRRWFLARRARGERPHGNAALFGSVVHALIEHSADGAAARGRLGELDAVWDRLSFDAHWLSASERAEAEAAVQRWAGWVEARGHRTLVGTEIGFDTTVQLARAEPVRLRGRVDRLELTADGRLYLVDYKTSRSAIGAAEAAVHDQLGVYQLAAAAGAFERRAPGVRGVAGGELVFLRVQAAKVDQPWPVSVVQPSLDEVPHTAESEAGSPAQPTWVHARVAEAAGIARAESFPARRGDGCRHCPFAGSCPALAAGSRVVA